MTASANQKDGLDRPVYPQQPIQELYLRAKCGPSYYLFKAKSFAVITDLRRFHDTQIEYLDRTLDAVRPRILAVSLVQRVEKLKEQYTHSEPLGNIGLGRTSH